MSLKKLLTSRCFLLICAIISVFVPLKDVVLHEPLTNLRRVIFLVMEPKTPQAQVWRALNGAAMLRADCGKYVIAVNEDIDPHNTGRGVLVVGLSRQSH